MAAPALLELADLLKAGASVEETLAAADAMDEVASMGEIEAPLDTIPELSEINEVTNLNEIEMPPEDEIKGPEKIDAPAGDEAAIDAGPKQAITFAPKPNSLSGDALELTADQAAPIQRFIKDLRAVNSSLDGLKFHGHESFVKWWKTVYEGILKNQFKGAAKQIRTTIERFNSAGESAGEEQFVSSLQNLLKHFERVGL